MSSINFTEAKPQRVVLLGKAGFIAAALGRHLAAAQIPTLALSAKDVDLCGEGAGTKLADQLKSTDCLVFVSALTPDRGKDLATMRKNLLMAESVIAALQKRSVQHVVYMGSDAVYDDNAHLVHEGTPLAPQSFHGIMHLARETALAAACASLKIPLLLLRPCAVYGTGDTHNGYGPNRFINTAHKDGVIQLFGGGEEKRDHIHIDDLATITVRCVEQGASGILNLATGSALSFAEVAALATGSLGRSVEIKTSPRANPITHRHFDVTRLIRTFPTVKLTALSSGLAQMAKSL